MLGSIRYARQNTKMTLVRIPGQSAQVHTMTATRLPSAIQPPRSPEVGDNIEEVAPSASSTVQSVLTTDVVQGRWDRPVNQDKRVYVQFVLYSMYCIIWPMNPVCTFAQSCGMSTGPTVRIQAACRTRRVECLSVPRCAYKQLVEQQKTPLTRYLNEERKKKQTHGVLRS